MLAGSESLLGRHRVVPGAIRDRNHCGGFSVDHEPHLARRAQHTATQGRCPVGSEVIDERSPGVALLHEVGEAGPHAGIEHQPRFELLSAKAQARGRAAAVSAGTLCLPCPQVGQPAPHSDQGGRVERDSHHEGGPFRDGRGHPEHVSKHTGHRSCSKA